MSTIIRTIKIPLDAVYTQNTDIGLYTYDGVSELRYTESPLAGVYTTYKEGLIIDIGAINHKADFRDGGAQVQVSDVEIILGNSINNQQFNYLLKEFDISLIGQIVEIEEYVGTEADSDATEVVNLFTGSIESVKWNELEYKITAKSSLALRRNNYLCKKSGNIVIPATFGESDPDRGIYFKALRTVDTNKVLTLNDIKANGGTVYPETMSLFPIYSAIGTSPSIVYQVQLGQMDATALPNANFFNDKYILIKEGKGGVGVYRRIHNCSVIQTGTNAIIQIELYDYLTEDMVGNPTGDHKTNGTRDQTSIQFVDIDREYELDSVACDGFYNSNNVKISSSAELYSLNNDEILRIPAYGYDVDQDNTDNNSFIIDPKLFKDNPDTIYSYHFLPITSISLASSNLNEWYSPNVWVKLTNGVYKNDNVNPFNTTTVNEGSVSDVSDKSIATYYKLESEYEIDNETETYALVSHVFNVKLPKITNSNTSFSAAYVGIYLDNKIYYKTHYLGEWDEYTYDNSAILAEIKKRGYIDRLETVLEHPVGILSSETQGGFIDNMPDFYVNRNYNNVRFYTSELRIIGELAGISGAKLIDLNVANIDSFNAIEELLISIKRVLDDISNGGHHMCKSTTKIYELFIMLESTASIKTEVYV